MEFVKNFTPSDFQVRNFTPAFSPNFNSISKKKHKKWVKMEKFTPLAKILHCRRHWRHGQIPPLPTSILLKTVRHFHGQQIVPIDQNSRWSSWGVASLYQTHRVSDRDTFLPIKSNKCECWVNISGYTLWKWNKPLAVDLALVAVGQWRRVSCLPGPSPCDSLLYICTQHTKP